MITPLASAWGSYSPERRLCRPPNRVSIEAAGFACRGRLCRFWRRHRHATRNNLKYKPSSGLNFRWLLGLRSNWCCADFCTLFGLLFNHFCWKEEVFLHSTKFGLNAWPVINSPFEWAPTETMSLHALCHNVPFRFYLYYFVRLRRCVFDAGAHFCKLNHKVRCYILDTVQQASA